MALSKIDVANMLTGATPVANGGTGATTFAAAGLGKRPNAIPLAYNGNMEVSQRSTSVTGITAGSDGYHTLDRFAFKEGADPDAVFTMTQETLTSGNAYADGFNHALKMDVTTADGSLGGDDFVAIEQRFEKQDLGAFKKGTANAEKFTVAFWVKATKTGTNILELDDRTNDRAVSATYTISTTNTWEHKVVSFPADTTGNFGTGNAVGLILRFYLLAGTGYTSGSLQTTWGAGTTNKRANGQINNGDSTSNNWHLTGVQLEVGEYTSSTLPDFQHESFGDNLQRCQRYYILLADNTSDLVGMTAAYNGTTSYSIIRFPTEMRSDAVSVEQASGSNYYSHLGGNANAQFNSFTVEQTRAGSMRVSADSSKTQGDAGWFELAANGRLAVEDEL